MNVKLLLLPLLVILIVLPSVVAIQVQQFPTNFFVEASLGSLENFSTFIKRGHNDDLANGVEEDLWEEGGNLQYLNTSEVMNISSTDADDVSGGTGGQRLLVQGLDNDYEAIQEFIRLNGTTVIQTTKKYLRLNQVLVQLSGSTGSNEGDITLISNRTGLVQSVINTGQSLDQSSHYTVAAGKRALILKIELNAAKLGGGQNPEISFKTFTRLTKTFVNASWVQLFDKKMDTAIDDEIDVTQIISRYFPPGTDFRVTATSDTNNAEARSRMFILLVDAGYDLQEVNQQMPIAIILGVISVIVLYFFVLIRLFTEREFTEHGMVKLLFYTTAFWILLFPINMIIAFNNANLGPSVVSEHLETIYIIMVWLNFFITVYFVLWLLVQLLKKIGNTKNKLMFENER